MCHSTNECKTFCKEIQTVIEQGRIKFDNADESMKIDGHPFPANALDVNAQEIEGKAKVLTSDRARRRGAM